MNVNLNNFHKLKCGLIFLGTVLLHMIMVIKFVQELFPRYNYIESSIEEDIDLKNDYTIKNLHDPINIREPASKIYVDNKYNDSSIIKKHRSH